MFKRLSYGNGLEKHLSLQIRLRYSYTMWIVLQKPDDRIWKTINYSNIFIFLFKQIFPALAWIHISNRKQTVNFSKLFDQKYIGVFAYSIQTTATVEIFRHQWPLGFGFLHIKDTWTSAMLVKKSIEMHLFVRQLLKKEVNVGFFSRLPLYT